MRELINFLPAKQAVVERRKERCMQDFLDSIQEKRVLPEAFGRSKIISLGSWVRRRSIPLPS